MEEKTVYVSTVGGSRDAAASSKPLGANQARDVALYGHSPHVPSNETFCMPRGYLDFFGVKRRHLGNVYKITMKIERDEEASFDPARDARRIRGLLCLRAQGDPDQEEEIKGLSDKAIKTIIGTAIMLVTGEGIKECPGLEVEQDCIPFKDRALQYKREADRWMEISSDLEEKVAKLRVSRAYALSHRDTWKAEYERVVKTSAGRGRELAKLRAETVKKADFKKLESRLEKVLGLHNPAMRAKLQKEFDKQDKKATDSASGQKGQSAFAEHSSTS